MSVGDGATGEWSVHVQPGCEAHVRLALTDVLPDGVNEIQAFLEPDTARGLARELLEHADWCDEWKAGMHRDDGAKEDCPEMLSEIAQLA
ncbi:hypothetical protein [Mycobacterium dioxanotrophicus]|uniref:hypothetical protein n=1 Tax=Mycobacterium dioxanotrophicus TaxID=482462 RepID=UPI0012FB8817|nr:hypothetical protein [Mycobacterium dioxanotrophicus]